MRSNRHLARGFTLIEMAVVLAVIAILAVVAFDSMRRSRPRATLTSFAAELQSTVHAARQDALAYGTNVVVLVFPTFANGEGLGRIIVIRDDPDPAASVLNKASPVNLTNYLASTAKAPSGGKVLATLDLPKGVQVGPATGAGYASLPYPYDSIAMDVDCSFCTVGGNRVGAIFFDGRGRADFRMLSGSNIVSAGDSGGASLTIFASELDVAGGHSSSTLVVTKPQGMVRTIQNG